MAEYIEREALKKSIREKANPDGCTHIIPQDVYSTVLSVVECEPAANVAEVKRGKWVKVSNGVAYWHVCSECMKSIPKEEYGNDYFSNYCPNCGAKMD